MSAKLKSGHLGFTLVELMIGITIMAILLGVAIPSFKVWITNTRIRTTAESVASGLQRARAEAVARNTNVSFVLGTGTNWTVNVVNPASVIESRYSAEGSTGVTTTVSPTNATTITFNNLGGILATNADASAPFTQVDFAAAGGNKNLRVVLGLGGVTRMCDPSLASGSSPAAC
ncbi:MAG TPA: GspH/FimT family pseudopilin [Burkholderiaceae bacterium]